MPTQSPKHARLPPSGAYRWTECTASVAFIEANAAALPRESSVFADEGTLAHELAAKVLTGASRLIQSADPDMLEHVRAYVEFVREKVGPDDRLLVERRVPLFYMPDQHGTVDAAVIGKKSIYIADLKYGAGVGVYAKDNKQLASYAESLIREIDMIEEVDPDTLVTLAIFQPRDRNDSNAVRLWSLSRAELAEFVRPIEAAKDLILKGEVEFKADPDKQCRFCPASGICPTFAAYGLQAIENGTEVLAGAAPTLPDVKGLTREQRNRVLIVKDALTDWLKAVEEQETHELMNGASPISFKLVEGRTQRKWKDEAEAAKVLSPVLQPEVLFTRSILSPSQAEIAVKRALGANISDELYGRIQAVIDKPTGKPTLVSIEDKRPALMLKPTEGLSNLDVI